MNTMKPAFTTLVMMLGITALASLGCSKEESRPASGGGHEHQASGSATNKVQYTCSMHPDVAQDKPGKCPQCQMALVEKK